MQVVPNGTNINDFICEFTDKAKDALWNVEAKGLLGVNRLTLPEIGDVGVYMAANSLGVNKGYTLFVMLYEFKDENGKSLILEADGLKEGKAQCWLWNKRQEVL